MNFSRTPSFVLAFVFGLCTTGCRRTISDEERAARTEVRRALHDRSFQPAVTLARRVLKFAPNDNGAWARLAQAQFGADDLSGLRQTLADWERAVKRTPAKYHEYRGDLALADGHRADALAAWKESVARKDRKARVFIKIARLEQADFHWPEAAAAWTRGMKSDKTAVALVNRAICYRHLHSWETALADLHRAEHLAPQDPLVRQQVALLDRLGKFLAEVRDLDKELAALPDDAELLADRALLFLRAEDAALALDDARQAAQLATTAVRPQLFRALAERALGRTAEPARSAVHSSLRLEALSPEFLQTIRRLDAEIVAEPGSADLRTDRAWQLNEIDQPQLALADAESAIGSDPKSVGAYAEASYALEKLKREPEAYDQIKRATELDPNFSTAWQYRGELEMRRADYPGAIDSLTRALAINQTAAALTKREECYRKLGLLAKAENDHKALEQFSTAR
jgi:tetratricopeptide (TPR) repeat protein